MSKPSGFLQRQRNFWSEALWKPKSKLSLEQLKYLHYVLTKNAVVNEHNRDLLVETLRSMAEILIWGDQNDAHVMDFFLEKNMLSFFLKIMKQKFGRFVCVQLLQTLNILFENMRNETSLYYLLSNNHINAIIVHKFDFSDEEVLAYYISFLKTLSLKLNRHTIHFFYNEHLSDFPLYAEAIQFFNHSESMVRIAVRTISLNVYQIGDESVLEFICNRSAVPYFSNLVWFIGNHVLQLDECVSTTASHLQRGRLESMVAEQLDLVHYLNDILSLSVSSLNHLLVSHLLDRLIIPLYIYSLEDGRRLTAGSEEQPRIGRLLSLFLLAQKLLIIKHGPLVSSLAEFIVRGETRPPSIPADGSTPKITRHSRYPSHGSLRAFIPPAEPIGVTAVPVSRTSSVNSVPHAVITPSPSTSTRGLPSNGAAPSTAVRQSASNSKLQPGRDENGGARSSRTSSLASFTDVTGSGDIAETVSNELIPMVSVHRGSTHDDGTGSNHSDEFSVSVLQQRTMSVGKSRFFSGMTPETDRHKMATERGEEPAAAELTVLRAETTTTDGGAPSSFTVTASDIASSSTNPPPPGSEWREVALEAEADAEGVAIASPSADEHEDESVTQAASDLDLTVSQERVSGGVGDGDDSNATTSSDSGTAVTLSSSRPSTKISRLDSEVDSGVFSEQTQPVGTSTPDAVTVEACNPPHPLQIVDGIDSKAEPDTGAGAGDDEPGAKRAAGASPMDTLTVQSDELETHCDMSPYLKTALSSLAMSNGDDREALFSIVMFYAMLRHKGVSPEVFENIQVGINQVAEDVRSVLVDHVIQLINQICHDCTRSRLITLQAALVVLQHLMTEDPRARASSAALLPGLTADLTSAVVASHGESTPADAACTTADDALVANAGRDALAAFVDTEPTVPNTLPKTKDSTTTSAASLKRDSSSALGSSASPCAPESSTPEGSLRGVDDTPRPDEDAPSVLPLSDVTSASDETDGMSSASTTASGVPTATPVPASQPAPPPQPHQSQQQQQQSAVFHKRVTDTHIAHLHGAYEDSVRQLRLLYKGAGDDMFLDMFEDEYFNITKGERLNIEYLMNDASTLLPPTPTPLTGIPFSKRLPNGEVERTRRAMQVFFLSRQLVVNLLGEKEDYLPLMPTDGQLKVDDRPNLMNTDLLACEVYMDDTEKSLKRFFFIGDSQMILVEPDMTQLGWGVVRYVANLEDIDVATDSGDNSLLHVTFHQPLSKRRRFGHTPKQAARQPLNTCQFEFNDHIRCTAAKKRILQACERVKTDKQNKICALLQVPNAQRLRRETPSAVALVGLDSSNGSTLSQGSSAAPVLAVASGQAVMSPMNVPPSVPAPLEIAPLVIDTGKPASAPVMHSQDEFEVVSIAGPVATDDDGVEEMETTET